MTLPASASASAAPHVGLSTLTCLSYSEVDHIGHLVLNRPDTLNTMHPTFWRELDAVLTHVHRQGTARVLVLSSTGRHFSAGMSLQTFAGAISLDDGSPEGRAAVFDQLTDIQSTFTKLESLRVPVVCALHGGVVGGAVDLVTAACVRYASADTFFCIQEINIGMVADVGTLQRLPKLLPLAVVKELAYTGRRLSAADARGWGLVNAVLDTAADALAAALQCAREIAAKPPVAIWGTKQAIAYARDHSVDDALKHMGVLQGAVWSNAHVREAIAAQRDQRPPQFPDLSPLTRFMDHGT
jgi:enoyl-CoA hydratase